MRVKETRREHRGGAGRLFIESRVIEVEKPEDAPVGAVQVSDDTPLSDFHEDTE